ncbi:MAG: sigma-70 family RNA polymerase sigma factor [Patescibacteria group bacterium]
MNEQQFEKIFAELAEPIFRFIYFRVFDRELAKDLTQEVFCRVWKVFSEGKKIDNLRAYIYLIARNLVIDESRKKKNSSLDVLAEKGADPPVEVQEVYWQKNENDNLLKTLRRLKSSEREVLEMRYLRELKVKEIAEILQITSNAVSLRLKKSKKMLKDLCYERNSKN